LEFKLKIPANANFSEEELLNEYQNYAQKQMNRGKKLDAILERVDNKTFDM